MSLDNIQLPPIVTEQLFKKSLVQLDIPQQATPTTPPVASPTISFLGNNQQHIVIVVNDAAAVYVQEEALNFLLGILGACKLTMEDVGIVNIAQQPILTYQALAAVMHAKKVIQFGVTPAQLALPLEFPMYQVQAFNQQKYLHAPSLLAIQPIKEEKTKLWNSLKQLFGI